MVRISKNVTVMATTRALGRATFLLLMFWLSLTIGQTVSAAKLLDWDNLAPPLDNAENLLDQLTKAQINALYAIVWGKNFGDPSGKRTAMEQKAYESLEASGADPVPLIAEIERLNEEAEERQRTLVPGLDGTRIKLAGYVLPLEFDGTLVRSFLLVPYVGACIHVPPPPPNQVVYVEADKPFLSQTLYSPVWVTGRLKVGMDEKLLSLVDGSSPVAFGYSLEATAVEPYKE